MVGTFQALQATIGDVMDFEDEDFDFSEKFLVLRSTGAQQKVEDKAEMCWSALDELEAPYKGVAK